MTPSKTLIASQVNKLRVAFLFAVVQYLCKIVLSKAQPYTIQAGLKAQQDFLF